MKNEVVVFSAERNFFCKQTKIQGVGDAWVPIVSEIMDFSEEQNCVFC